MTVHRTALTIAVLAGLLMIASAAAAQQGGPVRKIGFLSVSPEPPASAPYPYLEGFRQGLRDRGWIEGQNLTVEYRWAAGRIDALPDLARELVRLNVDVIVTYGNKPPHMLKETVKTTPIIALSCDPLETMVSSLARPTGNITGVTCLSSELTPKKLELLLDAAPTIRRLTILYNPNDPGPTLALKLAQEFGVRRQVKIEPVAVGTAQEFEPGLGTIAQSRRPTRSTCTPIRSRLASPSRPSSSRRNSGCPRSMDSGSGPKRAGSCPTGRTSETSRIAAPATWTRSSRVPSPRTCPWSSRRNSSSSST